MEKSDEILKRELLQASKLNGKRRGEIAELALMRKAATLGFGVARPWGDSDRYDVIVSSGSVFWRVQCKSVWAIAPTRPHYRVKTSARHNIPYTAAEIDFLVAYIFPENMWYVFPVSLVEKRQVLCLRPHSRSSPLDQYREAWSLLGPCG